MRLRAVRRRHWYVHWLWLWRWTLIGIALLQIPVVASLEECGVPVGQTKIVGGQDVPGFRYPWFVALVRRSSGTSLTGAIQVSCGGSLITTRHVLSAAHCFPMSAGTPPEKQYLAVFHLVNRCRHSEAQAVALQHVDINPSFNMRTLLGDIAVITLDRTVQDMPICLPAKNSMKLGEAVIIGFGSTLTKAQYPCVLQEAKVNVLSRRQCTRTGLSQEFSSIPGTICAGLLRGGVDSCDGDSGGPLMTVSSTGTYTLIGIVSFGEGCARKNLPGVYTQVSAYRDFIDKVIQSPSGDGDSSSSGGSSVTTTYRPGRRPYPHYWSNIFQGIFHRLHSNLDFTSSS